jgi:hypothetical protein
MYWAFAMLAPAGLIAIRNVTRLAERFAIQIVDRTVEVDAGTV